MLRLSAMLCSDRGCGCVAVKSAEQQSALMLQRSRDLLVWAAYDAGECSPRGLRRIRHCSSTGYRRIGEPAALLVEDDTTTLPSLAS